MLDRTFRNLTDLVREHAAALPSQTALIGGDERVSWRELDAFVDRIAASLQRDCARVGGACTTQLGYHDDLVEEPQACRTHRT